MRQKPQLGPKIKIFMFEDRSLGFDFMDPGEVFTSVLHLVSNLEIFWIDKMEISF